MKKHSDATQVPVAHLNDIQYSRDGSIATVVADKTDPGAYPVYRAPVQPKPRPISEWCEDMGDQLWWKFPIEEAPYCGSPLDLGREVMVQMEMSMHTLFNGQVGKETNHSFSRMVGGWPGYHTHFTPIPMPDAPDAPPQAPSA